MKKQDQSPVAASEKKTTSSANSGELFDETLSKLAQVWEINVDNIDISARVAEVIAAETVVPLIGSEPIQIPDEFVQYLQANDPAEPRLTDFSGIPVSFLKLPVLTIEQEKRLGRAIEQERSWAIDVLVNANQHIMYTIIKRYEGKGVDLEELIQAGMNGLKKAAYRFDYHQGVRFSTFATHWIQQEIGKLVDSRMAQSPSVSTVKTAPSRIEVASDDDLSRHRTEMSVPFIDLTKHKAESEALSVLTAEFALEHRVLPVKRDGNRLWVAMQNVRDIDAVDAVRMASRCLVQPMAAKPADLDKAITEAYGSLEPPQPPAPPTANAAPAPEPYDETSQLLRETLSELRGMRDEISSLRREVAELRRDRSASVPRPSTARLFPFAPENVAHRNR